MAELETFRGLDHELRVDSSEGEPGYLVIGPNESHIRLSPSAYHLLQAARSGADWRVLANRLSQGQGRAIEAAELEASYERIVQRLVAIDNSSGKEALAPGFWFRWRLLSRTVVNRVAARLSALFAPWTAMALLGAIGMVLGLALSTGPALSFSGLDFWPAYALFLVSLMAHEFGHVSACRRYGARPNAIGVTIYLIFPAFYSDVTPAWQLARRHRVIVDLGGIYFQLVAGMIYWLAFLATGWRALETALVMILYGCLFSLNPVFRFDGYWVLADALGVPHLSRQPRRLLRHFADRLRGRPVSPLPWPRWVTATLLVYTPLCFGVWAYFVVRLAPAVWSRLLEAPDLLLELFGVLSRLNVPDWGLVHELAVSAFLLLASGVMVRHLAGRLVGAVSLPRTTRPAHVSDPARLTD